MEADTSRDFIVRGELRAAINVRNPLLVVRIDDAGDPVGVAPDVASEIARMLDVPLTYVLYASPGELAADAASDAWDIGLIGAEPKRAQTIDFTGAYVEAAASYLVHADSSLSALADVDRKGVRISVPARTAYDLWLQRHIRFAELVPADDPRMAREQFAARKLEVLAGLREQLKRDAESVDNVRLLDGAFTAVRQSVGIPKGHPASVAIVWDLVEQLKASGFIESSIERHDVRSLTVAAPSSR